ncbi:MAG: Cof-type HAD-IIB family hydrolase [Chloroflexi bacterium]|nr:Cof-type HAD-IIB family hydrolase [Chloroflexota bacterium]
MYKLIAIDIDGTLIGKTLTISPRTKNVIGEIMASGIHVTLATGRMFQSALPYARELDINIPIICYQGALIGHPVTREILWHKPVPLNLARQAIEIIRKEKLHLNAYLDDELFVEHITDEARYYAGISRVELHVVSNLASFLDRDPTKLVVIGTEPEVDAINQKLIDIFGNNLYIIKSYPKFCEIAHPDCSKAKALAKLAVKMNIDQSEIVAIGDNPNDLDMIEWAGLGVAMGNSSSDVIAAADMVTGHLEEDGVAQVIEKLFKL